MRDFYRDLYTTVLSMLGIILILFLAGLGFLCIFNGEILDFLQRIEEFFGGYTVLNELKEDEKVKLSYSSVATLLQNDSPFLKISASKVIQETEYENVILLYNNKEYRVVELSLVDYIKFIRLKKRLDKQKANLATKKEEIEALRFAKKVMEKENKRIEELANKEREKCKAKQKQAFVDVSEYAKNAKKIANEDIKLILSDE